MDVKQQYVGHHHEYVEVDPTGRYGRYNEILGKGASKIVYRAFDEYEGIEVAWNQVKLTDLLQRPEEVERLQSEIHLLKTLEHKHIMKFYTSWVDAGRRNINFVTELFTSGTLRQYRQKHKSVNIRAVKHWCQQILKGLLYLHSHDPPIIHRDLKCDNIFINGNQGVVKIGDLGLASILRKSQFAHCVGTPEFMAPEVYDEEYNELVDIYSFGMCLLEMVTFDYPYSECTHPIQIYKKVISGTKPAALCRIKDLEMRQFVEKCLAASSERLSAQELLKDPFLRVDPQGYQEGDIGDMCLIRTQPAYGLCSIGSLFTSEIADETKTENGCSYDTEIRNLLRQPSLNLLYSNGSVLPMNNFPSVDHLHQRKAENKWMQGIRDNVDITIKGTRSEDGNIFLMLRIIDREGHARNIHFPFDIDVDTALSVATEMVRDLDILDYDAVSIAEMIDAEVSSLVSDWKQSIVPKSLSFATKSLGDTKGSSYSSVLDYLCSSSLESSNCSAAIDTSTFEDEEGSEQCVTEGAPVLSCSQSEANDLSSHGSRESHSDEEGNHFNETVNSGKEIHADNNQHEDSMRLRVENGNVASSNEKPKRSLSLGKRFSFNFPPRRNLFSKSKSFQEASISNPTCEVEICGEKQQHFLCLLMNQRMVKD